MKNYLAEIFNEASNKLAYLKNIKITFDIPKNESQGDLSSNAALLLSKQLKKPPRKIAEEILSSLVFDKDIIKNTEIAGPGFINFYFTPIFIAQIIKPILTNPRSYGKSVKYNGKKANVEFVSANPTGPLTVGHGRNAVVGDTIANLLGWVGYEVDREYYFNNAGRQMRILGDSVRIRYLELLGNKVDFPEDYYQGEYITEIARKLVSDYGDKLLEEKPEGIFKDKAEQEIFVEIKNTLQRLGIIHKIFFNENSLYEEGKIVEVLDEFKNKDLSYEKDSAVWLKLAQLGNDQDKVIVKATGEPTYRLPDIAYHITKFKRNYDLMIDIFGSDHNATYPDVLAGLKALSYDDSKVKVLIHQFVTITENGEIVKMSTRKANYVTLDQLVDDVGADVVRYFFNMRNISSHMNFDLTLARKQSEENPVFYLQYAHARISSIIKMVENEKLQPSTDNLNLLTANEEQLLLKKLHQFENEVLLSAEFYETHRICVYLEELAAAFHKFYTFCRIIGSEKNLAEARLALAVSTRAVIKNGLMILGVSAPEKM
ncbi:MAG: arginine--tRNA ligase [Ignavibacteria bacterium RIFOXYB2_FULL_35_12]|nr:MAG: arginine--tRNA ligase [Ignavibacteria bacterium GWA2_36_19]OGU50198.1 MAG: arginine--tRNA ligase [Ignavibacteria bacterium GWC2_35_8]OGU56200.1 MAG: arginine--tRNA ligase [Ignavibacteria bacterium GWF2_35_20]OGU83396.1 MAG: arginine--tRNA ligase [Ignavibacteria bacterium RIFOXYA2_FULL_35_9]OGU86712.1 MAG: arginine--tRNA ligase [Ignavibacteria bacterium RIFOXYC12_FULL_35_11]OGU89407.1 MAG: arginine--tRNA ligase [Ignavibacteria bacterium RIFOXYA12_FULL_35_25]OGU94099.1 MAG: arginine--tR